MKSICWKSFFFSSENDPLARFGRTCPLCSLASLVLHCIRRCGIPSAPSMCKVVRHGHVSSRQLGIALSSPTQLLTYLRRLINLICQLHYSYLQAASVHTRRVTIFCLRLFHVVVFVICAILAAVVSAKVRTTGYFITSAYNLDATQAVGTNRYPMMLAQMLAQILLMSATLAALQTELL